VIKTLEGSAADAVRGMMVYRVTEDFCAGRPHPLPVFAIRARRTDAHHPVPCHRARTVGETGPDSGLCRGAPFGPRVQDGEQILLEGRLVDKQAWGLRFDCRASDRQGRPVMLARGITLRRFEV